MPTTTKNKPALVTTPAAKKAPKPKANPLATLRQDAVTLLATIDKAIASDAAKRGAIVAEIEDMADALASDAGDIAADMLPSSPVGFGLRGLTRQERPP